MKNMKKLASLLLALVMVFSLATTAFAADDDATTYSITINGKEGHTYEVYQIFTGDLSSTGVLSNIAWGTGITTAGQTELGGAAKKAETLVNENDARAFGEAVEDFLQNPSVMTAGEADNDGRVTYTLDGLNAGYYLIKDKNGTQEGTAEAYTAYILRVVRNITPNPKDSVPEVDKEIVGEGEVTDVNIGDTVTFTLTATLGNEIDEYEKYKLVFHDTMAKGLTYVSVTSVTVDGDDNTSAFTVATAKNDDALTTLTVSCDDVKALGAADGSKIVVTYTATLNSDAEIGTPGNENKVYVEYSNDPNWEGDGNPPTGDTPADEVLVFTYELDVTKIDGATAEEEDPTKLPGAEFKLYRMNGENKEYVVVANNKVYSWTTTEANASTLTSGGDGKFVVIGLDQGTYYLQETKAPEGYNLLADPIKVEISATVEKTDKAETVTDLKINVTSNGETASGDGDVATGIVNATVENNEGATLPSTGGMGTTLFYVFGGILVAAAVVLLVTKKRMSTAE